MVISFTQSFVLAVHWLKSMKSKIYGDGNCSPWIFQMKFSRRVTGYRRDIFIWKSSIFEYLGASFWLYFGRQQRTVLKYSHQVISFITSCCFLNTLFIVLKFKGNTSREQAGMRILFLHSFFLLLRNCLSYLFYTNEIFWRGRKEHWKAIHHYR